MALDEAALVERGGAYGVTLGLVNRDALAGERTLVDGAVSLEDYAIDRNVFTRTYYKNVALLHLVYSDLDLLAVTQYGGCLGGKLHEALEGVRSLALAARLEHLADGDEGEDHGGGLEVEALVHDVHLRHARFNGGHLEKFPAAPHKRGTGTECDKGIHIWRLVR